MFPVWPISCSSLDSLVYNFRFLFPFLTSFFHSFFPLLALGVESLSLSPPAHSVSPALNQARS